MICSHDCDLENPNTLAGIHVAPIVPPDVNDAKVETLRHSWRRDDEGNVAFGSLFPIPLQIVDNTDHDFAVADFSRMLPAGPMKKSRTILLKAKTHELTDEGREALQWKLAAFFGRGG